MATLSRATAQIKHRSFAGLRLKIEMMGKSATADHFKKVREIINALIIQLKADLAQHTLDSTNCTTTQETVRQRKNIASATMADEQMQILREKATIKENTEEMQTLQAEATQIAHEQQERTLIRDEEQKEYDETKPKLEEGKAAVEEAIAILKCYYKGEDCPADSTDLLQVKTGEEPDGVAFRAQNADRDGNTVNDLSPKRERFAAKDDEYQSISALLETILQDFTTSLSNNEAENQAAIQEYNREKTENDNRLSNNGLEFTAAEGEKDQAILDLKGAEEDHASALGDFQSAEETLAAAPCPKQETWEERSQARRDEIEQLRQALVILEERDGITNVR